MSLLNQSFIQALLNECDSLLERQQRQAKQTVIKKLDQINQLFRQNIKQTFENYSVDAIIHFAEIAVQIPQRFTKVAEMIDLFFERVQTTNQFYIRGLFVKAKVIAYSAHNNYEKGQDMMSQIKESISFISKALDLISPQQQTAAKGKDPKGSANNDSSIKSKYSFLIYNASITLYKITRFMFRPGWQKFFVDIYQRIYKLLQQVDEADHNWRCRFTLVLYQCLYDNDKKPDAFKILDNLWQKTRNKPCEFQDSLFRLRVYLSKENNALAAIIKKDIEGADPNGWKILQALQRMKAGLVPEAQIQKELMTIINQISLGVLSTSQNNNTTQLSPIMQERLAEAGRIALRFNLANLGNSIISYLGKTRQPSQKALVLNQYNKAELLIKKKSDYIDKKTGMSMNALQIKQVEIENRKQALKIMEKVMLINKKLDNAQLIYEGAVLVWNISLPFLCEQYHSYAAKALDISLLLLQQIDSNDHQIRTKFHLELINIYFDNDLMFSEVQSNVHKALKLDPSIPTAKLVSKPEIQQDISLYARPYQRYLMDFRQKVLLKTMQIINISQLDMVTQDLWAIHDHKSQTTKLDILQKCLRTLISYEESPFQVNPDQMLVQQQIKKKKIEYERQKLRNFKRRKLLIGQIAKLSFEWDLNDFAKKACEFVLTETWEIKNSIQLIIMQSHCCLYMAQIKIDELYQENIQPLYQHIENSELSEAKLKQLNDKKLEVTSYLKKCLQFALITQQTYLIFNGAICLWNNFIHVFRVAANDTKLKPDVSVLLKDYFQAMRNNLKQIETKGIVYYDIDDKIQIFSNVGVVYARLLQSQKQNPLVQKVCEDLLLTNLTPNTRKLVNNIKARIGGGKSGGKPPADPKKGQPPAQKLPGFNDSQILQLSNQIELIQNTTVKTEIQNQIIKCFDGLQKWKPNEKDESQLQLHAELWVKLSRLSSNEENVKMLKYALRCAEKALAQSKINNDLGSIPTNRLRWYSLAQFLSSEALLKLVNPKTQQTASIEGLLLLSLGRGVQAANKGFKCGVNILVIDAGKQVWNVCSKLQESKANRAKLINPIRTIITFIKQLKDDSEPDLLLLLSHLYFKSTWQNNLFKEGQEVADMMLQLLPKIFQKSIWQAKMSFMSKQGKNQLQAISSIKQSEPSLQAKLWVKLARIAINPVKQQAAYNKALEILKKEHSVQIVEVLIEYSQWQLRVGKESVDNVIKNLEYASNLLIEIEIDGENDEEDGQQNEDEIMTVNSQSKSRSLKSKKSYGQKSLKSSQKDIKNKGQKKPVISNRSKMSSGFSRMNRSGRAAQSVKNKNTKSVFSQREEDPNPDSLNCSHFEKLFRIYTILSSIHSNHPKKLAFALKALKNAVRMLQKSIETFNELQQNAAKLNQKQQKLNYKKIQFPESIDEWIKYQLPKEYLQRITKVENMNLLGEYSLEKPQLTYMYLCKLNDFLQDIGLDYQSIPSRYIAKYICSNILKNDSYILLEDLKLKKILIANRHPLESNIKIDFQTLSIKNEELKEQISKVQYQKSNLTQNSTTFDVVSAPNLIQPLSKYICWVQIGKVLIELGQIASAKNHLKEAMVCAKILSNSEIIGKIHIHLCQIAYLQGQVNQTIQHLMLAHRLCKNTSNWQKIVVIAMKGLFVVKKYETLQNLLLKMNSIISQLINDNLKQNEKGNFKTQINQLQQLLITVQIVFVSLYFKQTIQDNRIQNKEAFASAVAQLEKNINQKHFIFWNLFNYQIAIQTLKEIVQMYQSRGGSQLINLGNQNFAKISNILNGIQLKIKQFIKACNINEYEGGNYNHIIQMQLKVGFLNVNCLCQQNKLLHVFEQIQSIDDGISLGPQEIEKQYLKVVDKEIKIKHKPISAQLNKLELALTILNDIEAHIQQNSIHYPRLIALQIYVYTEKSKSSSEAFELSELFKTKLQEKLDKFENDYQFLQYQIKVFQGLANLYQQNFPNEFCEYLSKLQHSVSVSSSFKFLNKKLNPNHKFNSYIRLINSVKNKVIVSSLIQKQKLFNSLTKVPSYQQCIKLMPKNAAYIILKMSPCKSIFYFSCIFNEPQTNIKKFFTKIKHIKAQQLQKFKDLTNLIVNCRKNLIKTPIQDEKKMNLLIESNQKNLLKVKQSLQYLSKWWLEIVQKLLNNAKAQPPPTNQKDKKGSKDTKKKGGKDEIAGYQSPLAASPSGIDNITFLLDEFIYALPYEELIPVQLVASVTKDSSLFWLSRKLQQINFQPDLNNSNGFGADKGKYFGYDFKNPQINFKTISTDLVKLPQPLKFQGIDTSARLPSLGDYSRAITEPGYLQIYGSVDILNHAKFNTFLQQAGSNKMRLLIVHDNLNFFKSTLNKFKDLNSEQSVIILQESMFAYALIANLLNLTIIKNRWFINPPHLINIVKNTYKSLASGLYVGSAVRQNRSSEASLSANWLSYCHGGAVIRM